MAKIFRFSGYFVENDEIEDVANFEDRISELCVESEDIIQQLHIEESEEFEADGELEENCEFDMNLLKEVSLMYDLVNKMFIICMRKGLKLVMENPYSEEHFLRRYWCYSPAVIDRDRRDSGDYFKKPTQYWFLNCEPQNNLIFEPISYNAIECKDAIKTMTKEHCVKVGTDNVKTARSMIHPQYADRFIRQYILDEEIWRGKQ